MSDRAGYMVGGIFMVLAGSLVFGLFLWTAGLAQHIPGFVLSALCGAIVFTLCAWYDSGWDMEAQRLMPRRRERP